MNVLSAKVQSIKDWFAVNQKTIIASLMVVAIGIVFSYFINSEFTLAVILFIPHGIMYSLNELYKASDNSSVAAFLGAFFAFLLMIFSNNIVDTKRKKENKKQKSIEVLHNYFYNIDLIVLNQKTVDELLEGISSGKKEFYCLNRFQLLDTDKDTIRKIQNKDLTIEMVMMNCLCTRLNYNMDNFNALLTRIRIKQEYDHFYSTDSVTSKKETLEDLRLFKNDLTLIKSKSEEIIEKIKENIQS